MDEKPTKKAKKPAEPKFGRIREGLTKEQIAAQRKKLSADAPPEGSVKMSEVGEAVKKAGIPVSKLVRATGGDRAMRPPAHPCFQVTFVGRDRYLPGTVMTEGLELLADPNFLKTKRARKPKAEGEPAKKAKRTKTVVRPKA